MGRKPRNTIQRTVNMHPSLISEVRGYAKKRTDEIIKEEIKKCKCGVNGSILNHDCPYEKEINNNNNPKYCNCCLSCEQECCNNV